MEALMAWLGYSNDKHFLFFEKGSSWLAVIGVILILLGFVLSSLLLYNHFSKKITTNKIISFSLECIALLLLLVGGLFLKLSNEGTKNKNLHDYYDVIIMDNHTATYENKKNGEQLQLDITVGKKKSKLHPTGTNKEFVVENKDIEREIYLIQSPV
jgi:hypothetical protein